MDSIIIQNLSLTLFFALLFLPNSTFSASAPDSSPSPSPQLPPEDISPPPISPSPSPAFTRSPPAPAPASDSPSPAPSAADNDGDGDYSSEHEKSPSPSPAPIAAADGGQGDKTHLADLDHGDDDSEGMSGGKKAGIAMGVIAGGCVLGMAAVVYKKRQQNIRRAQYSYTDRRDFM